MSKGTPSFGKHQRTTHIRCRRCGKHSYNKRKSYCSACGFGKSSRLNNENWRNKKLGKKRRK